MPLNQPYYFDDIDDIIILPDNHKRIMKLLGQNGAFKSKAWFAGQILHQALDWFSNTYNNNAAIPRSEKQEKGVYIPFGLSTTDHKRIVSLAKRVGVVNIILELFFDAVDNGKIQIVLDDGESK